MTYWACVGCRQVYWTTASSFLDAHTVPFQCCERGIFVLPSELIDALEGARLIGGHFALGVMVERLRTEGRW